MARFEPTTEQHKIVETAERLFDARLAQPKRESSAFSSYFLERCSSELGIEPPHRPRVRLLRRKLVGVLEAFLGDDNWLVRRFRRR